MAGAVAEYRRPGAGIEVSRFSGVFGLQRVLNLDYRVCLSLSAQTPVAMRYRNRTSPFLPGHIALLEPGETHSFDRPPGEIAYLEICFDHGSLAERLGRTPHFRRSVVSQGDLPAFQRIPALFSSQGQLERDEIVEHFVAQLRGFTEQPRARGAGPNKLRHVRELLHDRYAEDLSLEELALIAGTSREQVCRGFARQFGLTPHQYLIQVRIHAARQRLSAGESPIDVALACGFADQAHLTRWFRRLLHQTPAHYARSLTPDAARVPARPGVESAYCPGVTPTHSRKTRVR
jgi:AraC-like DNA-binding protein